MGLMVGQIRLFEKIDGLLKELSPRRARTAREEGRMVSHMSLDIEVLWTPEEEEARKHEEELSRMASLEAEKKASDMKQSALAKLAAFGLTEDEMKAIVG